MRAFCVSTNVCNLETHQEFSIGKQYQSSPLSKIISGAPVCETAQPVIDAAAILCLKTLLFDGVYFFASVAAPTAFEETFFVFADPCNRDRVFN